MWQPIETAPGMKGILLFAVTDIGDDGSVKNWKMETGFYHTGWDDIEGSSPWQWGGHHPRRWEPTPTHWMPLPQPPEN